MKTWTSNEALALIPYQPEIPLHELLAVTTLKDTATDDDDIVLPSDIVPIILSYCDAKTLARASCVCQEWHLISSENELWERLCRETFGVSAVEIRPSPDPIKCLYIWNHKHLRSMVKRLLYNNQTVPPLGSSSIIPF